MLNDTCMLRDFNFDRDNSTIVYSVAANSIFNATAAFLSQLLSMFSAKEPPRKMVC